MKPPKPKPGDLVPSLKAAAAKLHLDVLVLKDAKSRGCEAFRPNGNVVLSELLKWLDEDRAKFAAEKAESEAEQDQEQEDSGDSDNTGDAESEGVGKAFLRIVKYERQARKAMDAAIAQGNPMIIKLKQDAWVQMLNVLIKYEMNVETAKRDSGELIPRSEVVKAFRSFLSWHKVGLSDAIRNAVPRIVGLTKPVEVARIIDPIMRESQVLAFDIGARAGLVPSWAAEAAMQLDPSHSPNDKDLAPARNQL